MQHRLSFAGHETFVFRYGWLKKGYDAVVRDPGVFLKEDAMTVLGVGKNMVHSIKHWCLACQVIRETVDRSTRARILEPSDIGRAVFSDGGWDPFLENPASLWVIHYLLTTSPDRATTWRLLFNDFRAQEFSKAEVVGFLSGRARDASVTAKDSTLLRDVDCFLRTYQNPDSSRAASDVVEDSLGCPLTELGLIVSLVDSDLFRFNVGPKSSLPAEVVLFALSEFVEQGSRAAKTLSLSEVLFAPGSPGQVFKLDENSVVQYLEQAEDLTEGAWRFDESTGVRQLYMSQRFPGINILERCYGARCPVE